MSSELSTVVWNEGLKRFQDSVSKRFVSFRDAAERLKRTEIKPGDWRLRDASGRFVGVTQFAQHGAFDWMSPNRRQVYFTKDTDPHVEGAFSKVTVNKLTTFHYSSAGAELGSATSSTGYGVKFSADDLSREIEQLNAYRDRLAEQIGVDVATIDAWHISYSEREYYNPIS